MPTACARRARAGAAHKDETRLAGRGHRALFWRVRKGTAHLFLPAEPWPPLQPVVAPRRQPAGHLRNVQLLRTHLCKPVCVGNHRLANAIRACNHRDQKKSTVHRVSAQHSAWLLAGNECAAMCKEDTACRVEGKRFTQGGALRSAPGAAWKNLISSADMLSGWKRASGPMWSRPQRRTLYSRNTRQCLTASRQASKSCGGAERRHSRTTASAASWMALLFWLTLAEARVFQPDASNVESPLRRRRPGPRARSARRRIATSCRS